MNRVEAKRNLCIYRHNINALNHIDMTVLGYAEKEVISAMLRRFKQLEKTLEQALYPQK